MPELFGRTTIIQLGNLTTADSYENLRPRFSVTKTLGGKPNSANIEVYGLSRESIVQYLAQDRDLRIRLLAGYDNTPSLIFDGFPVKKEGLVFEQNGASKILKIKAKDGQRRYEKARVNLSLGEATSMEDVLVEVAGSLGLPVGTIEIPPDVELTQGVHLSGQASDILDRLALSANADWSIQDGRFQFIAKSGSLRGQGPLFSDLLGNVVGNVRRKDKGVEVTTFINGPIVPGVIFKVNVTDGFYNGTYKAKSVKYSGDSHYDNDYYAVVEGVPFETQAEGRARMSKAKQNRIIEEYLANRRDELTGISLSKVLSPGGFE